MFRSHLTYPHVASDAHTIALSGNEALSDDGGALPGMGADPAVPQIPAPTSGNSDMIKRILLIGGIAAVVFLVLKHLNKKSEI